MIIDTTKTQIERDISYKIFCSPLSFDQKLSVVRNCFQHEYGWRILQFSVPDHLLGELELYFQQYHAVHPDAKERVLLNAMQNVFGERYG